MNENVRKVFDILGVEPYEMFKVRTKGGIFVDGVAYLDEKLIGHHLDNDKEDIANDLIAEILRGFFIIVKLSNKKHIGDLKCYEFDNCIDCPVCAINPYCKEEYSLYDNLEEYNDEIQDSELYDFLKKRLDEEIEND